MDLPSDLLDRDEVLVLLQGIATDVRVIREALAKSTNAALPKTDMAALRALVDALANSRLSKIVFTTVDLWQFVARVPGVLVTLEGAIGRQDAGSARRLGKLLARGDGREIGEWRLSRCGTAREGLLWRLSRV